jgi:ATP-dependent RNA helicase RhlE
VKSRPRGREIIQSFKKLQILSFETLGLSAPILRALKAENYETPTPIQLEAIPIVLEGRDLLGCAQTGTGKTAAFALPILDMLYAEKLSGRPLKGIGALVVTPTRELAIQIDENLTAYGRYTSIRHLAIFGGVSQVAQVQALKRGVDILVATPGRLLDLINQHIVSLAQIRYFVLDEADRMLDMGFIHDVKKIISLLPQARQTLLFSATMPPDIAQLAERILDRPRKVEVTPVSSTVDKISQQVYFVEKSDKMPLLIHLLKNDLSDNALIFTRTKHGADKVARQLNKVQIKADAIHGNKSQNARQRALSSFKSRDTRVLVATDIAARGIDVESLSYVINFDLPNVPETYVHRIGRTARAGREGSAVSFCDVEERAYLKDITKLIAQSIPVVDEHPFVSPEPVTAAPPLQPQQAQRRPSQQGQSRQRSFHKKHRQGRFSGGREGGSRDGGSRGNR